MGEAGHILVSLEARHADNIFSGQKRVELRRRPMNVVPGTTLWIYVKRPVGSIVGSAKIGQVRCSSPPALWRRYSKVSGLSKREFFTYFKDSKRGFALELDGFIRLETSLSLEKLRTVDEGFQPPQFFARLNVGHPLRTTVLGAE